MKIYENEMIIREYCSQTLCDICGADLEIVDGSDYLYNDCVIKHAYADNQTYEGADHHKFEMDICHECFKNNIIPVLDKLGVDVKYKTEYC